MTRYHARMSEQFYDAFVSIFFGFTMIIVMSIGAIQLIVIYSFTGQTLYYYAFDIVLAIIFGYALKMSWSFKGFREELSLLIPTRTTERNSIEPLDIEIKEDLPLQVCLLYRNGASFMDIEKDLDLPHPQQAKRELQKGLDILLKRYQNGKVELS